MHNIQNIQLENHIKIEEFNLKSKKEVVMHLMNCYPTSPTYEGIVEEYEMLEQEARDLVEPIALLQFGEIKDSLNIDGYPTGTPACYVFFTIGDKIKDVSRGYFDKGDYLSGMLVNAIADDYLFQLDDELKYKVEAILNMGITEGFMFTTVKSNCYILILSDNPELMNAGHECSKCSLKTCKLRDINNLT